MRTIKIRQGIDDLPKLDFAGLNLYNGGLVSFCDPKKLTEARLRQLSRPI